MLTESVIFSEKIILLQKEEKQNKTFLVFIQVQRHITTNIILF